MSSTSESATVMLRGGCIVPVQAILLCLDLEARGCSLELDGSDGFAISPRHLLNDDDRQQLRRHRDAIAAIVRYCETVQ